VFILVIGNSWLDIRDTINKRRLENSNDFVRLELHECEKNFKKRKYMNSVDKMHCQGGKPSGLLGRG
jgi:hypothetical protein